MGYLGLAYTVILASGLLALSTCGEVHWPLIALRYAPPALLAAPALVLFLIALTRRSVGFAVLAVVVATLVLFGLLDCRLNGTLPASGTRLRVVSWNVHHASKGAGPLATEVVGLQADVLLLQEVSARPHDGWPDPAPAIMAALPGWHFLRERSLLTASRFPLEGSRSLPLGIHRPALACRVRWNGQSITLINLHLYVNTPGKGLRAQWAHPVRYFHDLAAVREQAAKALLAHIDASAGPIIICGDLNSPPRSRLCQVLETKLSNCFRVVGQGIGLTFPVVFPLWRIDHICVGRGLAPISCRIGDESASDHRPVIADVVVQPSR